MGFAILAYGLRSQKICNEHPYTMDVPSVGVPPPRGRGIRCWLIIRAQRQSFDWNGDRNWSAFRTFRTSAVL